MFRFSKPLSNNFIIDKNGYKNLIYLDVTCNIARQKFIRAITNIHNLFLLIFIQSNDKKIATVKE